MAATMTVGTDTTVVIASIAVMVVSMVVEIMDTAVIVVTAAGATADTAVAGVVAVEDMVVTDPSVVCPLSQIIEELINENLFFNCCFKHLTKFQTHWFINSLKQAVEKSLSHIMFINMLESRQEFSAEPYRR